MKTAVLSVSREGYALARRIKANLPDAELYTSGVWRLPEDHPVQPDLRTLTAQLFSQNQALIFIMASGIAVRMVAPLLESKDKDPAILAMDDQGRWVIPLVSGHLGGANRLAEVLAAFLGAEAVITTATDGRGLTAVDTLAQSRNWLITDLQMAKRMTAALLEGETLEVMSWRPLSEPLPTGYRTAGQDRAEGRWRIIVSPYHRHPEPNELWLIPRCLTLGMGCRRDTAFEAVESFLQRCLDTLGADRRAVSRIATIDLKADEPAFLKLAETLNVPLCVYTAQALQTVAPQFGGSEFVRRTTGVEAVCEPAGLLASGGRKLLPKQAGNGITLSIWEDC